jgi:hypothetical protein
MTLHNLVTKLSHRNNHRGLAKKHTLYYCFQCVDEYLKGERATIAMKVDKSTETFYRKPPLKNMRNYYHASSMICDSHWEKHNENKKTEIQRATVNRVQ